MWWGVPSGTCSWARTPDDYDVVTNARPEEIIRTAEDARIPVVSELGQNFGVVILRVERHGVEVAAYRNETYGSGDAHRPSEVWYCKTLEEDLSRRDFTINALAVDQEGHITDCFHGLDDLRGRVLRTVGIRTGGFRKMPCGCSGPVGSWGSWGLPRIRPSCPPSAGISRRSRACPWNGSVRN